jgi:hypothetical protein
MTRATIGESQMQQLLRIAKAVNSTLEVRTVLQTIVDTVCDFTHWRMAALAVIEGADVVFVAQRGFDRKAPPRWRIEESLTPRVTADGKTLVVADMRELHDLPAVQASLENAGYRSAVIAPLAHVHPPSALWLCRAEPSTFSDEDVAFAEAVADHAAIAMRNARLYETQGVLLQAVVENRTVEELLATTASLLGRPIWFEDAFGRRLPDDGGPKRDDALTVPIAGGDSHYGWLVTEKRESDAGFEMNVLQQAALVFSLSFLGDRVRHETETQIRSDLFSSLVSAEQEEVSSELRRRSRALSVDLPIPARVCLLDLRLATTQDLEQRRNLGDALRLLALRLPGRLIAFQEGNIALLLAEGEERSLDALLPDVRRHVSGSRPVLAVGNLAENPKQYVHSFRSAQKIVRVARFLGLHDRTLRSEDIGIYGLLFDEGRSGELEEFGKNVLGRLRRSDQNGKLWETLEALCEHAFELGPTAKALNLHVSTLRYRIERLRNHAGLDWSNPSSRVEIEIAVLLEKWNRLSAGG